MTPSNISSPGKLSSPSAAALRLMALEAQAALLPYALVFFVIGLVAFASAASMAANSELMFASLAVFAINWLMFYGLAGAVRRDRELAVDAARRTRVHVLGGLLWALAIAQISLFALGAGPAREALLLLAAAGAAACFVFLAPLLPALLSVGPAVSAGPIIALMILPETRGSGWQAAGGLALVMAMSLVVNRILQRQFLLTSEREQLAQAYEQAADAAGRLARSKTALIETLSQEVRSGLAGVAHVLSAASDASARSAPSREQLSAALDATRDLAEMLNATLDNETAEAGELSVRREPVDGPRLARDLVYLNQPHANAKGIELAVFVDPDLADGAVLADPARTRQALSALLGNALKYTSRGRVEVRVRREGEGLARFEIADTGPGLTPDELTAAFAPFTRIERTSAGATGAGLGLSLARSLARLMGGDVGASSAAGAGSCFWLDLPYDAQTASAAAAPPAAPLSARSLRVMLTLKDRLSAAGIRAILEDLGHQVIQSQGAERAAELLKMCPVDVVVAGSADRIDLLLGHERTPPVLALVEGEADQASLWLAAGCAGVLRPPATGPALARALALLELNGELKSSKAA